MVTDTVSDTLTRIRNANMAKHQIVYIPLTKMSLAIIKILKSEGFIDGFKNYVENSRKYLLISLKYTGDLKNPVICKIKRISKPGLRVYSSAKNLPNVLNNLGIAVISTSKGVMSNIEAKKLGVGGEVLCYIW